MKLSTGLKDLYLYFFGFRKVTISYFYLFSVYHLFKIVTENI